MRTYGSLRHDAENKTWQIKTEPHVAIRLKRLFGKIDTRQHGVITISATRENSRDLEWFLERYPMIVDPEETLRALSIEHREAETVLQLLLNGAAPQTNIEMKLPAREHQLVAANVWHTVGGYLLADDVGVGKTVSAICGLLGAGLLPSLVTTLTALPRQWESEIQRFTGLNVHILTKGTPYDIVKQNGGRSPDIIISNYHKLSGWASTLSPIVKSLVFDEVQELRHTESNKYAAAAHLASVVPFRIGLTATPIFNYGAEIYNILNILRPGALGTFEEFSREWCVVNRDGKLVIADPAAFGYYVRESGLMLRRTKADVKRETPPVTIIPHYVDADLKSLNRIKGRAIELAKLILTKGEAFKGQKMQARGEFDMRMRQETGIAKAPYVAEFVKFLHAEGKEKIVLYGWHREVYEIWLEKLKDLKPVMYTGTESAAQKEASKQRFINGDSQVMLISLRAGVGMDGLQAVSRIVVFGELDWSPAVHEQNIGRVDRDGQLYPVMAYYMLSDHGSDPAVSDRLGVKKQQLEGIRDPNNADIAKHQVEEDYIRKLAEQFLLDSGEKLPEDQPTTNDEPAEAI